MMAVVFSLSLCVWYLYCFKVQVCLRRKRARKGVALEKLRRLVGGDEEKNGPGSSLVGGFVTQRLPPRTLKLPWRLLYARCWGAVLCCYVAPVCPCLPLESCTYVTKFSANAGRMQHNMPPQQTCQPHSQAKKNTLRFILFLPEPELTTGLYSSSVRPKPQTWA